MKNLLVILFFATLPLQAQTLQSLKDEKAAYLACLDKGRNLKKCSQDYYNLADQYLDTVYKKLMEKCNEGQKQELKEEQYKWLKERDAEFAKIGSETQKELGCESCNDYIMMVADLKASFVLERVKALIMRLDTLGK